MKHSAATKGLRFAWLACNGCRQQSEGHLSWKTLICGDTAGWFYCDLYLKLQSVIFLRYENANDSAREMMQAQCICYRKRKRTWGGQTGIGQTADCLSFLFVCQSCMFFPVFLWSALGQNSCTANFLWYTKHHWMYLRLLHGLIWPSLSVISQHRERESKTGEGKTRICGTGQMVLNKNILFYFDFHFESKEIGNVVLV